MKLAVAVRRGAGVAHHPQAGRGAAGGVALGAGGAEGDERDRGRRLVEHPVGVAEVEARLHHGARGRRRAGRGTGRPAPSDADADAPRGRPARACGTRAAGCWNRRSASASTAPGSGSTPAIACGWISSPRSVRVALRPGIIVSAKACRIAPSTRHRRGRGVGGQQALGGGQGARARARPTPSTVARCQEVAPRQLGAHGPARSPQACACPPGMAQPVFSLTDAPARRGDGVAAGSRWRGVAPAAAAARPRAYDGSNPFICTLQDVGLRHRLSRTPTPTPSACEFNKTPPERDRARGGRLPLPGARAGGGRLEQVLLLPDRPLARLGRAGRRRPPRPTTTTAATSSTRRAARAAWT